MTSELDPRSRELIGLALQGERRLPRNRERVRRGVLAAVTAPAALGVADAAMAAGKAAGVVSSGVGAKTALLGAATWLKVAPLVIVSVAAGAVGVQQLRSTPAAPVAAPALVAAPAPAAVAAQKPQAIAPAAPVEAAPVEAAPVEAAPVEAALVAPAQPKAVRATSLPVEPPDSPAPPSLAAELEALQRAQRALNAGNAASALSELGAVRGPSLRAERVALEVFAHCALGNVAQAQKQAALFRQLAPRSPLLPRVNASCAGE